MNTIHLSLLRGVCQMPGYVASVKGFFEEQDLNVQLSIAPTAWMVPDRLLNNSVQFAVIPWTRVAAANAKGEPLVLICGSGHEEAAIVVRDGLTTGDVKRVAVPQEGGIKDLTAQGLMETLGWSNTDCIRLPSGDGAILALVGQGADAASMVEPYATMLQDSGIGQVVRRTGDLWPGVPGCSLTTTRQLIEENPDLVQRMVNAYVKAAQFVKECPKEAADIAANFIGIHSRFICSALNHNQPDVQAVRNDQSMGQVLTLMQRLGYLERPPESSFMDPSFLARAVSAVSEAQSS